MREFLVCQPALQILDSGLDHQLMPEFPACQSALQDFTLANPHNHMSQFLKIKELCVCVYSTGSVSLEDTD